MDRYLQSEYRLIPALKSALVVFEDASRRSGRTSRMLERAQSGDTVVTFGPGEKRHVERTLRGMGKKDIKVVSNTDFSQVFRDVSTPPRGEVLFSHEWTYEFVRQGVAEIEANLGRILRGTTKSYPGHDLRGNRPDPDLVGFRVYDDRRADAHRKFEEEEWSKLR